MRTPQMTALCVLVLFAMVIFAVPALGQDAPAVQEPAPAEQPAAVEPAAAVDPEPPAVTAEPAAQAFEMPTIAPDTQIFKRTPVIDGAVEDGEWDAFYSFITPAWEATTYADWDSKKLYFAAVSAKPIDLMITLDADADGWLHGEENYEIRITRAADGTASTAISRYDSRSATSAAAAPVSAAEAQMVVAKTSGSEGNYAIEVEIPGTLVRSLKLVPGRKIGLQLAVRTGSDENAWVPGVGPASVRECVLVDKKIAALKPLDINFDLPDSALARGEELVGKFHLTNTGGETVDVQSFIIAGEGKSGAYLSSQKVRMEGLVSRKHVGHEFRSIIPSDMPLGSWALGAEVQSRDGRLGGVLVSFDVVEPLEIELVLPEKPVMADVKDVTFGIIIKNNSGNSIRGTAKITLPPAWELWKNADKREFFARGESVSSVQFKARPPLGVQGEVPVKVEVTAGDMTRTAEGTFRIVNP